MRPHHVVARDVSRLHLEYCVGRACHSGEEDNEVSLKLGEDLGCADHGLDADGAVGLETEEAEATVGGGVLVLAADWLADDVDFDLAGFVRELVGRAELALKRVEGVEKSHGYAARRAKPGTGGNVGHREQFEM